MSKKSFYFRDQKSETCLELSEIINICQSEGIASTYVFEAEKIDSKSSFWCSENLHLVDKCDCRKSECSSYSPNNGKNGVCCFRTSLYQKGDRLLLDVESGTFMPF